ARDPLAPCEVRLHHRLTHCGGVRQLFAVVRTATAGSIQGLGRGGGRKSIEGETIRTDRYIVGNFLGRRTTEPPIAAVAIASRRLRQINSRLRNLEDALG